VGDRSFGAGHHHHRPNIEMMQPENPLMLPAWQTENKEFFISAGMAQGTERRPFSLLHFRKKHGKAIYVTNLWLFLPRKLFFLSSFAPNATTVYSNVMRFFFFAAAV